MQRQPTALQISVRSSSRCTGIGFCSVKITEYKCASIVMKIFTLVIVLIAVGYSQAIPTWGVTLPPSRGPGWSENAAASLYPAYANPYAAGYGYAAPSPVYMGSYAQSPSFPGYTPGLYGLGYLNLRH